MSPDKLQTMIEHYDGVERLLEQLVVEGHLLCDLCRVTKIVEHEDGSVEYRTSIQYRPSGLQLTTNN